MTLDLVLPKFKAPSGAERLLLGLGTAAARRGARVRILCHRMDPRCRPLATGLEIAETGTRLDRTGNHYLDSILGYASAFQLRRHLAPDSDAVCLFGPALPLAALLAGRVPRLLYFCYEPPRAIDVDCGDVLARVGGWRFLVGPALRLYRPIDRWLVRRVDVLLVAGEFAAQRVREEYGTEARSILPGVSIAPSGENRETARARLGLPGEAPVAVTVGFLHPRKRVDLLLRAWAQVERCVREARLLVVGDGPEGESLRSLARLLGLRNVGFLGYVPEIGLAQVYAAADVLVHVARLETFGLTILEAAAFGVPSVVVDEGGPRYTVQDGETGRRVVASPAAIAAALCELLSCRELARKLGRRAKEVVLERYNWDRAAREFLAACGWEDASGGGNETGPGSPGSR